MAGMVQTMQAIRVYTTTVCPYCVSAKRLLKELGYAFEEINLENNPDLRLRLSQENGGYRTVPMIFIGKEFIGGFTDLKALHDAGTLRDKVEKV
jgi:glutaredoxin 3